MRRKVCGSIFTDSLRVNDVFFDIIEVHGELANPIIRFVVKKLKIELTKPEQVLINQGEELDADHTKNFMYFLTKGECEVKVKDRQKLKEEDLRVRTLYPGDHFGVSSPSQPNRAGDCSDLQL